MRLILSLFLLLLNTSFAFSLSLTDLTSLVTDSRKLLVSAKEGTTDGYYKSGSKTTFETAINQYEAEGTACVRDLQLDSVIDNLHDAYLFFSKQRYGIQRPLQSDNYWELSANTSKWGPYNLHDPSVIRTKGYFYVYGTDAAWAQSIKGIPYRRSRDLVNWEYLGTVFNGSYPAKNNVWMDSLSGETGHTQTGIWAPYIMKVKNEYRLYYCSIHAPNGAVICLAVSSHPRGPWTQRGPLVYYKDNGGILTNAIDPTITTGKDGRFWMAWGSWSQGLYMTELDTLTGLKKTGASEFLIAKNRPNWSGTHSSMEGPEIIYNPTFKMYYLFVAEGDLGTIYQTRVARSINANGPYVDINNASVIYTTNKDVYPLLSYAYQFGNHPGWQGVAHCGVINLNGQFYMLNQGRPTSVPSMMDLHVKKIYWTESGWPVLSPERYSNPGIMPTITSDIMAGTWEEMLLNENKSGGISNDLPDSITKATPSTFLCKPTTLIFSANGTISPSGTWSYDGNFMTIIKGGYTYKVTIDWEWDWENGCATLIYAGLRSDGRTYWGKKSAYLDVPQKNIVSNPLFDDGLKGYTTAASSGSVATSIVGASTDAQAYISGNTFQAYINAKGTNYWDQGLSWRFPAQQGARYKVSLKYRTTPSSTIHAELQEATKDNTALYREYLNLTATTDISTLEFITNDVSITDPFFTLNLQYGNTAAGTKLLFDILSVKDITHQWDGNYVVNGGFENGLDSWALTKYSSTLIAGVIDTTTISGNKSYLFSNSASLTNNHWLNRIAWKTYLLGGYKYRVSFDVVGSGSIDAYLRLTSTDATQSVADILGSTAIPVSSTLSNKSFEIPAFTSNGEYTLCFSPREAGTFILDNIRLEIVPDTVVSIRTLPKAGNIGILPNPCSGTIQLTDNFIGYNLQVLDLQGRTLLNTPIIRNVVSLAELRNGIYMVRISTKHGLYTDKLVLQNP
jgi:arabinan endo-1,5-alpha-L-arabinosidase